MKEGRKGGRKEGRKEGRKWLTTRLCNNGEGRRKKGGKEVIEEVR